MRRELRVGLFVLWTVLASWALLEVALRVGAGVVGRPAPTGEATSGDPQALRVLALGDSWTAGSEAPPGQGFVDGVERGLAERHPSLDLRNLGRPGANSAHVALRALDQLPVFEPHLLLLLVGVNNGTSFAEVADFDRRFGTGGDEPLFDGLRTVKAARLLSAGLRGTAWEQPLRPELRARAYPEATAKVPPVFLTLAGSGYYGRVEDAKPPTTGSPLADLAWQLLNACVRRDLARGTEIAAALSAAHGWDRERGMDAPKAVSHEEVLGRYALLRFGRETEDWRAVRRHGGALHDGPTRTLLSDVGAAEAALLAGNWRLASAYFEAAARRAPGFPDLLDLASRFPPAARSTPVEEILESPAPARATELDRARHIDGWRHPEDAAAHRRAWLDDHPWDDVVRTELALWALWHQGWDEADPLVGLEKDWDRSGLPPPKSNRPAPWRYYVHRAAEAGGEDRVRAAVEYGLDAFGEDPEVLFAAARVWSVSGKDCAEAVRLAKRHYLLRGDPQRYLDAVGGCQTLPESMAVLDRLVARWEPLEPGARWSDAWGAGRDPEALFQRHVDAVLEAARAQGTKVLLLSYPNPRHEYEEFQARFAAYAESRGVPFLDLHSAFAADFSPEEWEQLMAPGGHCNAAGYAEMARRILARLDADPELALTPGPLPGALDSAMDAGSAP